MNLIYSLGTDKGLEWGDTRETTPDINEVDQEDVTERLQGEELSLTPATSDLFRKRVRLSPPVFDEPEKDIDQKATAAQNVPANSTG
jgi:hypothetical protein